MSNIATLKRIPIFHALTDAELRLLEAVCEIRSVKKGETLFKEGQPRDEFFVQLSGQIHIFRVYNDEVETLALLDREEFAVETALVDPRQHHEHSAEMLEDGELLVVPGKTFTTFRQSHPEVTNKIYAEIIQNLATRLHHANNKIVTIYFTGKIAATYDDLDHLTDLLLSTIQKIIKARRSAFILFQPLEGKARIQDAAGYHSNQEVKNLDITLNDDPILGPLFHSGRDILISEEQFKEERALHTPYASRNMLAVPIKIRDKIIGAILLGDKEGGRDFSHNNQILLNIIARQVALPIATAVAAESE